MALTFYQSLAFILILFTIGAVVYCTRKHFSPNKLPLSNYRPVYGGDITADNLKILRERSFKNGKLTPITDDFFIKYEVSNDLIKTYKRLQNKFINRGDLEELDMKLFNLLLKFNFTMNQKKILEELSEFNDHEYSYIEIAEYYLFLLYHVNQYLIELHDNFLISISSAKIDGNFDYQKLCNIFSEYDATFLPAFNFSLYYKRFKHLSRIIGSDGFYRSLSETISLDEKLHSMLLIHYVPNQENLIAIFSDTKNPNDSCFVGLLDIKKKLFDIQQTSLYCKCKYLKAFCILSDKSHRFEVKEVLRNEIMQSNTLEDNMNMSEIKASYSNISKGSREQRNNPLYHYLCSYICYSIELIHAETEFFKSHFKQFSN